MENARNMQERLKEEADKIPTAPTNSATPPATGWSGISFFNPIMNYMYPPKSTPETTLSPESEQVLVLEENIKLSQQIEDAIHEAQEQEKMLQSQELLSASTIVVTTENTENTENEVQPQAVAESSDLQKEQARLDQKEQELDEKLANLLQLQQLLQQQKDELALKEKTEQAVTEATRTATEEAARAEAARIAAEEARVAAEKAAAETARIAAEEAARAETARIAEENRRIEAERQQAAMLLQQQQQAEMLLQQAAAAAAQVAAQQQCAREAEQRRIQNMKATAMRLGF